MLFTLLIIVALIVGVYTGIKRGILHQLIMSIGFAISFWIALNLYDNILYYVEMAVPYPSPFLPEENPFALYSIDLLFELDTAFYHILSFLLILFIGWLLTRFIGVLLQFLTEIKIEEKLNAILGAVFSFIFHYIGIFFILFFLSTIPLDFIQNGFVNSWLAETIVTNTPNLSDFAYNQFIAGTIELNEENTDMNNE